MLTFELYTGNKLDNLSWPTKHNVHYFYKLKGWLIRPQYTHPLCLSPCKISSSPVCVPGHCWHMTLRSNVLTCICECSDGRCLLTRFFKCSAVWRFEGHGHSVVVVRLVFYAQRFLQIPWIFWWHYAPLRAKYLKSLQPLVMLLMLFGKVVSLDHSLFIKV